jgi:MerT mercuric transport protein
MKIEILYLEGCPNHNSAVQLLQDVLIAECIAAEVSEINVEETSAAHTHSFLGSPSIRVNGLDIEPAARFARDYGVMCRTYEVEGRREGLPSREMLRRAILEAQSGEGNGNARRETAKESNGATLFAAGSILAAISASLCCVLPIVFALTGFSILGASALFSAWRPYLLGLTVGLLGLGFYFAYRPRTEQCAPGSVCAMRVTSRWERPLLWLVTLFVILFAAFPYYSGSVAELLLGAAFSDGSGH